MMFPVQRSTFPWLCRNSSQAAANNHHLQRIHQRVSKGHDLAGGIALVPRLAGLRNHVEISWNTLWLCQNSYWKYGHRNSEFTHWTWWFSIVMLVYQRVSWNEWKWLNIFLRETISGQWCLSGIFRPYSRCLHKNSWIVSTSKTLLSWYVNGIPTRSNYTF